MQPARGGGGNELSRGGGIPGVGSSGGSGRGGGGGGGLTRYRSAPATWLEALLEEEVVESDVVLLDTTPTLLSSSKPPQPQPPISATTADLGFLDSIGSGGGGGGSGGVGGGGISGFLRQNSSPAEFLSHLSSDEYLSSIGIPSNYDYLMPSLSPQSSSKRPRVADSETPVVNLSTPLKGEPSEQYGPLGGFLDAGLDKLSEDSVLCRARAKRGFATHPRSIAERVRRTRISDRIRKLQELVPNMDKQTNTADMLEEAVEYVKYLKKQIQELTEHQKNCKCSPKE